MENKDISSTEYVIEHKDEYFEDIEKHSKSGQKKLIEKIITLLDEITRNPKSGTGHPEALKGYGDASVWSRRIDGKHRLTYEIFEEEKKVKILTAYGHYGDK